MDALDFVRLGEQETKEERRERMKGLDKETRKRLRKEGKEKKRLEKNKIMDSAAITEEDIKREPAEGEECNQCAQVGHVKRDCPIPRKIARIRKRDLFLKRFRRRKERQELVARRRKAAAGQVVGPSDPPRVSKKEKALKRRSSKIEQTSVDESKT